MTLFWICFLLGHSDKPWSKGLSCRTLLSTSAILNNAIAGTSQHNVVEVFAPVLWASILTRSFSFGLMNPDSRVPSSRVFTSRPRRPAMRARRNTASAPYPSLDPFQSHNLNLDNLEEYEGSNRFHVEDLPNCRCIACHLKNRLFPRRDDGRIILPVPWLLTSQPVPLSMLAPSRALTPQARGPGERPTHVPDVRELRSRCECPLAILFYSCVRN